MLDYETTLHELIQSSDPNSLLVAQDLVIELNCGMPTQMRYICRSFKSICGDRYESGSYTTTYTGSWERTRCWNPIQNTNKVVAQAGRYERFSCDGIRIYAP